MNFLSKIYCVMDKIDIKSLYKIKILIMMDL